MMKKQFCSLKKYTTVFSDFSFHCVCKFYCGQAFFYRKNRDFHRLANVAIKIITNDVFNFDSGAEIHY
jgi:hypothetical protein